MQLRSNNYYLFSHRKNVERLTFQVVLPKSDTNSGHAVKGIGNTK